MLEKIFGGGMREKQIKEHYERGEYKEVIKICDEGIRINPRYDFAWVYRGKSKHQLGRYEEAIQDFDEAIRLNPNISGAWEHRGESKQILGRNEEAIQDLNEALRLNPKSDFAKRELVKARKSQRSASKPKKSARMSSSPLLASAHEPLYPSLSLVNSQQYNQAQTFYSNGEYQEAIEICNEEIKLHRSSHFAWVYRGAAKRNLGFCKEALEDFDEAIRLNSQNDDAWAQRGITKLRLGRNEEAIQDLNEALRLNPKNSVAKECLEEVRRKLENAMQAFAPSSVSFAPVLYTPSAPVLTMEFSSPVFPAPSAPVLSMGVTDYGPTAPLLSAMEQSLVENPTSMVIPREKLIFGQKIGEGSVGEVYKGEWMHTCLHETPVAIKQLKINFLSSVGVANFKKEVEMRTKINSTSIVKLYGITAEEIERPYCMVMEFMELGTLRGVLERTEPEQLGWNIRLQIAKDIATGIAYLHGQNPIIVHGDINSLNVLLDRNCRAKITGFGLSTLRTEISGRYYVQNNAEPVNKVKGSLLWMAPELFKMNAKRVPECDMFSYGIVLWELASHKLPYLSAKGDEGTIKGRVRNGERESFDERTPNTPDEYRLLTEQCWHQNPKERLTANSALKALDRIQLLMFSSRSNSKSSVISSSQTPKNIF